MRDISATLLAKQKATSYTPLVKIVLTLAGEETQTYTRTRIKNIQHTEEDDRQTAQVILNNSDNALTDLDLKGYQGVISYGMTTSEGDEYSATAPLKVLSQQLISWKGKLVCVLDLAGIPNQLAEDRASGQYTPDEDDTDTVKTIIRKLMGDSGVSILSVYDHCTSYDVEFDSEDSLIDSYQPKTSFSVNLNENRLSKLTDLMQYTNCARRFEDDGKLHIFVPNTETDTAWEASTACSLNDIIRPTTANNYYYICTTGGTSGSEEPTWTTDIGDTINDNTVVWTVAYDYGYGLSTGDHTFFEKSYRKRLVIPNYITVSSLESQENSYSGYAEDTDSSALLEKKYYRQLRVSSNQQCTDIAEAILARYQRECEKGYGIVPMNVGAEVGDFVKVTDSWEDSWRAGNIGQLNRRFDHGNLEMSFRFGKLGTGLMGVLPSLIGGGEGTTSVTEMIDLVNQLLTQVEQLTGVVNNLLFYLEWLKGYIYINDVGDICMLPKYDRYIQLLGHLGMSSGKKFGLNLTTENGYIYWITGSGTYDHVFGPDTTAHGKLGDATHEWLEGYIKKIYADSRAVAPVGADMFD